MNRQCVNCPGATDHDTAHCPMVRAPRELLERIVDPHRRVPQAIHLHNADCLELRALLSGRPQASAAQSAPADESSVVKVARDILAILQHPTRSVTAPDMWKLEDALKAHDEAAQSAPAGEREALQRLLDDVRDVRNADDVAFGWHEAIEQLGAAWQRTQSAGVPEGWKLVPVEPTSEMLKSCRGYGISDPRVMEMAWGRMLAAAPDQPAAHDQGEVQRLRDFMARVADHADYWGDHPYAEVVVGIVQEWREYQAKRSGEMLAASTGQEVCHTCNGVGIVGHSMLCPECRGQDSRRGSDEQALQRMHQASQRRTP